MQMVRRSFKEKRGSVRVALIKCPECGKEVSDKANTCIHCGYPLSIVSSNGRQNEVASLHKKLLTETQIKGKEYSIKIINCNGSNAKAIITLKNKFQYSIDEAKTAIMNLPFTVTTTGTITEIKEIAQDFTDAGIEYEVFQGEKKISLNLVMRDKSGTSKNVYHSSVTNHTYIKHESNEHYEENIPKCPTCKSTDIKKISFTSKAGSAFLWGIFAVGKVSKQWHCNNCGSEW